MTWSCSICHAEATTTSEFKKPAKKGCSHRKGHDWKKGSTSERQETLLSILSNSSISVVRRAPEHFSEAETWDEAYELLAPWATYVEASEVLDDVMIFSNVGSAVGALTLYREMQGLMRHPRLGRASGGERYRSPPLARGLC